MRIDDGTGSGRQAKVNSEFQLGTFSVVETEFLSVNVNDEKAFVWDFPAYDYDAGDTVMWLRNDSELNLHIHHVYVYSDTATVLEVHRPINVTPAGTAIVDGNINFTSGVTAEGTAYQDETVGVKGTVLKTEYMAANSPVTLFKEEGYEIILGKNDIIAIDLVTAGTSTFGHIVGFYK